MLSGEELLKIFYWNLSPAAFDSLIVSIRNIIRLFSKSIVT